MKKEEYQLLARQAFDLYEKAGIILTEEGIMGSNAFAPNIFIL